MNGLENKCNSISNVDDNEMTPKFLFTVLNFCNLFFIIKLMAQKTFISIV